MAKTLYKAVFKDKLPLGGIATGHIDFGCDASIALPLHDSSNLSFFAIKAEKDGELYEYTPEFESNVQIATEIDEFLDCIKSGEKLANHIDTNIITAKMMQAIYDSAEAHREIALD